MIETYQTQVTLSIPIKATSKERAKSMLETTVASLVVELNTTLPKIFFGKVESVDQQTFDPKD